MMDPHITTSLNFNAQRTASASQEKSLCQYNTRKLLPILISKLDWKLIVTWSSWDLKIKNICQSKFHKTLVQKSKRNTLYCFLCTFLFYSNEYFYCSHYVNARIMFYQNERSFSKTFFPLQKKISQSLLIKNFY